MRLSLSLVLQNLLPENVQLSCADERQAIMRQPSKQDLTISFMSKYILCKTQKNPCVPCNTKIPPLYAEYSKFLFVTFKML